MTAVARPWTKWSVEVERVEDLPVALRRAVQTALTPPTGPVFLSLPVDIQMADAEGLDMSPIRLPNAHVRPPAEAVEQAAKVLFSAKSPGILAGSRVTERGAIQELVRLAELWGAPVISESGTTHGRLAFPCDHPLNAQGLPLWSPEVRERLKEFDVLLVVGMDLLRQYVYHEPARAIPEHIRLVHIDEDPWQLGKNYPVEVGLIGHTKTALSELRDRLSQLQTAQSSDAARRRAARIEGEQKTAREKLNAEIAAQGEARPLTPLCLMNALAGALTPDTAVVEEAVTTTNTTLERLGAIKSTSGYFGHRGWALGWGLGVAIGARLAWPDRPVLAVLGEGAAMYGIQGLWSAARYRVPVTFVICNNAQYQILKIGAKGLSLPHAKQNRFEGMDIVDPEIDFVGLARSLGVEAHRANEPDEVRTLVKRGLAGERPMLIDVAVARGGQDRLNYG
jgi:benzoylformate decarboxylase